MTLLGSKGLIWGHFSLHFRAGGGFSPVILIRWRVIDWLLLDVYWDWDVDGFLDDHFLVYRDMNRDSVGTRDVNDLLDRDGVRFRDLDRVGNGDRPRDGHVLEDGHRVVFNNRHRDTHGFGDRDGDGFRDGDRLRDGNDLLDGLIDGNFHGHVDWRRNCHNARDGDDFGHVNDFGNWHVFRDVYDLMDHFDYRGLVMIAVVSVMIPALYSTGQTSQEDC